MDILAAVVRITHMVKNRSANQSDEPELKKRLKGQSVRQPKQDRSIETRERIIAAGLRLFSDKGYHKTNSKEIVRAAGTGIGTFYDYFTDKKDLFFEILIRHRDESMKSLQLPKIPKNMKGLQLKKIIGEIVLSGFKFHEDSPEFHKEAVLLRHSDTDIEIILNEWDEALRKVIIGLLNSLQDEVRLKDIEAASYIIIRTMEDNIHFICHSRISMDKERLRKELTDLLYMYIFGG